MPDACDIQDINRVLRQPIFAPLSDARIAGRQMNPMLVMLLRELGRFSSSHLPPSAPLGTSHRREVYEIEPSPTRPDQLPVCPSETIFGILCIRGRAISSKPASSGDQRNK
jgi:hypothetical protein